MNDFHFHAPETIEEAAALLAQHDGNAKLIAGGTALTTLLKQSLVQPEHLVSLHRVKGHDAISHSKGALHIGALATQRAVEKSAVVKKNAPLLAEAYRRVATVRIRNVATVGGGIAHADPAMDPPPSLLILGASVKLFSSKGERTVPLAELYTDYYETTMEPDEIVIELTVPDQPAGTSWTYIKYLPRTEDDYATVSVAAIGQLKDGVVADVRVGLGALGPTAIRATALEDAVRGTSPTHDSLKEASQAVMDIVEPIDDPRGSAGYKRDMSAVFARRAMEQVLGVATG